MRQFILRVLIIQLALGILVGAGHFHMVYSQPQTNVNQNNLDSDMRYYRRTSKAKNLSANDRMYILLSILRKYETENADLTQLENEIKICKKLQKEEEKLQQKLDAEMLHYRRTSKRAKNLDTDDRLYILRSILRKYETKNVDLTQLENEIKICKKLQKEEEKLPRQFDADMRYYRRTSDAKNLGANDRLYILLNILKKYETENVDLTQLKNEIALCKKLKNEEEKLKQQCDADMRYYRRTSEAKNLGANDRLYILLNILRKYETKDIDLSLVKNEIQMYQKLKKEVEKVPYMPLFAIPEYIHVRRLKIDLYISFIQDYNDNIYLETNTDKNGDQVSKTAIGIRFKRKTTSKSFFNIQGKYFTTFVRYNHNSNENREDHTVSANADFIFARYFKVKLIENFKKSADPATSDLTGLNKHTENTTTGILGYKRKKIGFDIGYKYIRDNNYNFNTIDKKEYIIIPIAYYNFSPKTSLLAEYNSGRIRYDENTTNNDSDYTQWYTGIKGKISPKITGIFKVGFKSTDYHDTRTLSKKDFKGGTISGNINYKLKRRTGINLNINRSPVESIFRTNNYYVMNRIIGSVNHRVLRRMYLTLGGLYSKNTYPEEVTYNSKTTTRKDIIIRGSAALRYKIKKRLSFLIRYSYKDKDSNFDSFDYINRIVSGTLSVKF